MLGEVMVKTIPARHYLYGSIETDFKGMGKEIGKVLTPMIKAAKVAKQGLHGPVIHVYHGAPHVSPDKGFKMETGFFVQAKTKELDGFHVRELPELKCATLLYTGPTRRIGDAWQKLYRSIRDKGLTPTGEERELYLYLENPESPNNVVQVQVGVK